jgi:hypothetical protein
MIKFLNGSEKQITNNFQIGRRDFIKQNSLFVGGLLMTPTLLHGNVSPENQDQSYWYNKPRRMMHTVLRETDAKNYNAEAVIEYLQKAGYNTLSANAGGITDFFQNPLPAANINPFMGDRDILKEMTTACKNAGINFMCRVDFRGSEEHIYKKFPDWYMRDANQNPVLYNGAIVPIYRSCYLSPNRNEYANELISYVMKNYAIDGIYHNAPGADGICYCHRCQESYGAATGKDIPLMDSASELELDEYMVWKAQVADQYMDRIKKTVKSFGNDKAYTAEVFTFYSVEGRINSGIDLDHARRHFDINASAAFLTGPHDRDNYYTDLNYGNAITTFFKSMVPEREAVVMWGGNGTSHRMVIDPPTDLKVYLWEILSVGGGFWNCYFTNVPTLSNDNRNAYLESEIQNLVKENEDLYEQQAPVANVGIYYSKPTRVSYREESVEDIMFGTEIKGLINVLIENHIPYDFILDDQIGKEKLKKYKLLILPNVRIISKQETEIIKNYVQNGGNLLATYATSLYNAEGTELKDFGLRELFGVNYTGNKLDTNRDTYQYILEPNHPLVMADSKSTELLFNSGYTLLCQPAEESKVICTMTPIIHNQPPDKSWVEKFETEYPTIVENNYGKGKVLYYANQLDALSYTIGHSDTKNLLSRGIKYLSENTLPIQSTTAPSSVHIGLTKSLIKPGNYILSLVNTTSAPIRPIQELIPVNDIQVNLKLEGKSLNKFKVLRSQGDCKITSNSQVLDINISRIEDFCSIHIQMNV